MSASGTSGKDLTADAVAPIGRTGRWAGPSILTLGIGRSDIGGGSWNPYPSAHVIIESLWPSNRELGTYVA